MLKTFAFLSLLFLQLNSAAQWTTHIEAENYAASFGVIKFDTSIRFGHHSWVDYTPSLPNTGIYQIKLSIAGLAANIWITDTNNVCLGKIHSFEYGNEQTYRTVTSTVYLKNTHQKIRLFFSSQALMIAAIGNLNWIELKKTELLVSNDFEADWMIYQPSTLPWNWCRADSASSMWESSPGYYGWIKQTVRPGSLTLYNNGSSTSYSILKCELKKSDTTTWPNVRAEIYKGYSPDQTMYFRVNFMSPDDLTGDGNAQAIWQTHGSGPLNPPVSCQISGGRYLIRVFWSAIHNPTTHQGEAVYDVGPYEYGVWVKWVLRVKWAWDNTGELQIWKNDTEVVTRINLPNCYNEDQWPYFKIGIYKWGLLGGHAVNGVWVPWANQSPGYTFTHYYDSVRIGGASSSIAEVSQNN